MDKELFIPDQVHTVQQLLTTDLEQVTEAGAGWELEWTILEREGVEVSLQMFQTPRLQYVEDHYSGSYMIQGAQPAETVAFALVRNALVCNFRNRVIGENELMMLSGRQELDLLLNGEHRLFTLTIEKSFFDEAFSRFFGEDYETLSVDTPLYIGEKEGDRFIRKMKQWIDYFIQLQESNRVLTLQQYSDIEMQILYALFDKMVVRKKHVQKREKFDFAQAREVLHSNIDNVYNISNLLDELHISARTLQYHFKQKFGLSPKQYLHHLRLNAVRRELMANSPETLKVEDAALKYGFFHASHFGSEYKKLFGETPSQTLKQ